MSDKSATTATALMVTPAIPPDFNVLFPLWADAVGALDVADEEEAMVLDATAIEELVVEELEFALLVVEFGRIPKKSFPLVPFAKATAVRLSRGQDPNAQAFKVQQPRNGGEVLLQA
jgi:hypothetical protein